MVVVGLVAPVPDWPLVVPLVPVLLVARGSVPGVLFPWSSSFETDFNPTAMNMTAPVPASSPPSAMTARTRSTMGLNCTSKGDWLKVMSQWRRGTPKLPAKVIDSVKMSMPPANRYGWTFASGQNATLRWKISGIR